MIKKLIEANKSAYYFHVIRKSSLNSDVQIFNDEIRLLDNNGDMIRKQACDSIADKFIMKLGGYSKPTEDDYTIAPGIMALKKSTYRNRKTGLMEPAYIILSGYSKNKKWKLGKNYTLYHMIHRSSYYNCNTPVFKNNVKRGSSGGCIVLPNPKLNDILDYADKLDVRFLIITEEIS